MIDPSLTQRGLVWLVTLVSTYFAFCSTWCLAPHVPQQQSIHKHCIHHIDKTLTWIGLSSSESRAKI